MIPRGKKEKRSHGNKYDRSLLFLKIKNITAVRRRSPIKEVGLSRV